MAAVDHKSGENESSGSPAQTQHLHRTASPIPSPPPTPPYQSLDTTVMHLEPRPFRPFKSSEEYLWAMKEDLAEWLNALYGLDLAAENFLDKLETGVTLCQHANNVRRLAVEQQREGNRNGFHQMTIPAKEVVYRADVPPGTFHARDNVSNFIAWCRALGVHECLQFETDDLVMRKNERSFILCLLEVARRGAKLGMPAPLLVQMEEEIDREIAKDKEKTNRWNNNHGDDEEEQEEEEFSSDDEPPAQIITNDLKSLDEMVRDLVNRCCCPIQFPMVRVSEGKYRIGDTNTHIFVRILRSHVMVRVGGGWDTLEHYLDKHDPCRCRQGHRFAVGSKLLIKHNPNNPAQTQMQVTYERSPDPYRAGHHNQPVLGRKSLGQIGVDSPLRPRRASLSSIPSSHDSRSSLVSVGSDKDRLLSDKTRRYSGDHSAAILASLSSDGQQRSSSPYGDTGKQPCDRSSEQSDEGYQSGSKVPPFKTRKYVPQKLLKLNESGLPDGVRDDRSDSSSVVSGLEKLGSPESPCSSIDEHPLQTRAKDAETRRARSNIPTKASKSTSKIHPSAMKMARKKSQSTENLGDQPSMVPYSTSAYSLSKGRRLSGSPSTRNIMTRSRSQCSEDSEMVAYLSHNAPGRGSLRVPRNGAGSRIPRMAPGSITGNNTWSHRQRESRPALTADLFSGRPPRASGGSHSPSPHRRKSVTPRSSPPRSLQSSPSKHVAPLIHQVLAAAAAAEPSNEELLKKMAELIQNHFSKTDGEDVAPPQPPTEVMPGENYTKMWVATSAHAPRNRHSSGTSHSLDSPEDSGGSDVAEHPPPTSRIPVRINPRRDNNPGPTRIPMPTFYKF